MKNKYDTLSPFKIKNQLNQLSISDSLQRLHANKQVVNLKRIKAINRLIHIDEQDDYLLPQQLSDKQQQHINNKTKIKDINRKGKVIDVANFKQLPNLRQNVHRQKQVEVQQIFKSYKINLQNQTSQNKYTSSFKNYIINNQLVQNSPIRKIQKTNKKQFFSNSQKPISNPLFIPQLRSTKSQAHPNFLRQFLSPQQTKKSQSLTAGSNPQQQIKPQKLFIQNTPSKISKYHSYCQICDQLITRQDKHTCNKILNTFLIINEQLDQILKIIQKYKLDQYYSMPQLIKKCNKCDELQLLHEFFKTKKNNEHTIKNRYEQAVLSRIINICGKKMGLII